MITTDQKATNIMKEIISNPELFAELSRRTSNFIVFYGWEANGADRYDRNEPDKISPRVFVYQVACGDWHYMIAAGVIGSNSIISANPSIDAESAMKAVDEILEQQDDIILVR